MIYELTHLPRSVRSGLNSSRWISLYYRHYSNNNYMHNIRSLTLSVRRRIVVRKPCPIEWQYHIPVPNTYMYTRKWLKYFKICVISLLNLTGYRLLQVAVTRSAVYNVQTDEIIVLTEFPKDVYGRRESISGNDVRRYFIYTRVIIASIL